LCFGRAPTLVSNAATGGQPFTTLRARTLAPLFASSSSRTWSMTSAPSTTKRPSWYTPALAHPLPRPPAATQLCGARVVVVGVYPFLPVALLHSPPRILPFPLPLCLFFLFRAFVFSWPRASRAIPPSVRFSNVVRAISRLAHSSCTHLQANPAFGCIPPGANVLLTDWLGRSALDFACHVLTCSPAVGPPMGAHPLLLTPFPPLPTRIAPF
jgi:hypothetical protein